MKNPKTSHLCPLCGSERKPAPKAPREVVHHRLAIAAKPSTTVADSVVAESSDDKTANDFAEVLLNAQKRR